MSFLKGPEIPSPAPPPVPPNLSDAQAAAEAARAAAAPTYGRAQTVLTSGMGVPLPQTQKKTLLGATS